MEPKDRVAKEKNAARPGLVEIKTTFPPESIAFFRAEVRRDV